MAFPFIIAADVGLVVAIFVFLPITCSDSEMTDEAAFGLSYSEASEVLAALRAPVTAG